jgi:hypothetical protein
VFILDWLRTPRGKGSPKGSLHHLTPVDLVVSTTLFLRRPEVQAP